jgi:uncharacterized protein YdeI (YjbR/CyaY-like superfamily)
MSPQKSERNRRVDVFLKEAKTWREEIAFLRELALEGGLTEELKWGQPCYTLNGRNIFLLHGFKEYFAILFIKGALMADPKGILIQQTKNVQEGRQIRLTSLAQATKLKPTIKKYIQEAIKVEESGVQLPKKSTADFEVVEEFESSLNTVPGLRDAFEALTPGRQRGYLLHFAGAKQSATRLSRIEKATPRIFEGKGITD